MKMSPSGKSAKRQRPSDVKVDTPSRPKRLKTDQQVQIVHKKDAATEASSKERDVVVKASSGWSLDLMFRGHIYDIDPIFSTDEKYARLDLVSRYSRLLLILVYIDTSFSVVEMPFRSIQCQHTDPSKRLQRKMLLT